MTAMLCSSRLVIPVIVVLENLEWSEVREGFAGFDEKVFLLKVYELMPRLRAARSRPKVVSFLVLMPEMGSIKTPMRSPIIPCSPPS